MKWKLDERGDYSTVLPSGISIWIYKSDTIRKQPPWKVKILSANGKTLCIRNHWSSRQAKKEAEKYLKLRGEIEQ